MLYETVVEKLKNSSYTVVLSGNGQIVENGYPVLRDGYSTYDNETKYGYSGEEIFSSAMYSTRKELFTGTTGKSFWTLCPFRRERDLPAWASWNR